MFIILISVLWFGILLIISLIHFVFVRKLSIDSIIQSIIHDFKYGLFIFLYSATKTKKALLQQPKLKNQSSVLFIHGWLNNAHSWEFIAPYFSHSCVITIQHTSYDRFEPLVEYIESCLQKKNSSPWILVGHSLGGNIAALIAARNRVPIHSLVTLGSPLQDTEMRQYLLNQFPLMNEIVSHSHKFKQIQQPWLQIASNRDLFISPWTHAWCETNIAINVQKIQLSVSHTEFLFSEDVLSCLKRFIGGAS